MYIGDQLIYLELHKTACSHVLKLLQALPSLHGKVLGKHNPLSSVPASELGDLSCKLKLGSIRNPWDWYVSLWAFGCLGKGGLHGQVTKPHNLGRKIKHLLLRGTCDKHLPEWKAVYESAAQPAAFRSWLKMLFSPKYKYDIGEGFGFAPLSGFAGLLTYRYLVLFTPNFVRDSRGIADAAQLEAYATGNAILDCIIRSEKLEEDFRAAMRRLKLPPAEVETALARHTSRTNASERGPYRDYYDAETRELVATRDRYLIHKFGYSF